jgi:hypothetical protein
VHLEHNYLPKFISKRISFFYDIQLAIRKEKNHGKDMNEMNIDPDFFPAWQA